MTIPLYSVLMQSAIAQTRLIVGLEIHVELCTRSKMFTRAPNPAHVDFDGSDPNSLVDPLVAALPGTLPVMNRAAVEMSARVGMALGCLIAKQCRWDRKNYFYPDLPKGYQISQYDQPLCGEGKFELPMDDGSTKTIGIIRAHLEEDTGKLGHELPGGRHYDGSLVDLNRAGTPLLEIVTAPDFASAAEVVAFAQNLRVLCRFLGVTEGVMQKGHMRFEPNINVEITLQDGTIVRTPIVEVKNLNSFKAVKGAIEYEFVRQVDAWKQDGRVMGRGMKATRGWLDEKLETVLQREKEDAHDYRYFPDPDLVPVQMDAAWLQEIHASLTEQPLSRQRCCRSIRSGHSPPGHRTDRGRRKTSSSFTSTAARVRSICSTASRSSRRSPGSRFRTRSRGSPTRSEASSTTARIRSSVPPGRGGNTENADCGSRTGCR